MLALAAAAHGQDSSQILIIIAALVAAMFWRTAIRIGLALVIIGGVIVLVNGDMALFHDLRVLIP